MDFAPKHEARPAGLALPGPAFRFYHRVRAKVTGYPNVVALQAAGLRLGENVYLGQHTMIDPDFCWLVSIGDDTVISARVTVLAHDASTQRHIGFTRINTVRIGQRVFVG